MKTPWIEKYRPTNFDEFVFQDDVTKTHIMKFVEEQDIPSLMFSGGPGTGKTSCAQLLLSSIGVSPIDVLLINASKENSVSVFREKVSSFCDVSPLESDFKVVYLEEADYLTEEAQSIMRRLIEERFTTVRFLLTLNKAHKVELPITSRFQHFVFSQLPTDVMVPRIVSILEAEGVAWELDDVERVIARSPHDLRRIIGTLDQYSTHGKLQLPHNMRGDTDRDESIVLLMQHDQWDAIRTYIGENVDDQSMVATYRTIYNNLHLSPKLAANRQLWEQAVVHVAEYLHRNSTVADPFINMAALTIEIKRLQ
jgi:DNA polymerase III delta prime subunit